MNHLFRTQQTSYELNIITGFHLFDDELHLFVLEGRKEEAIDILYKSLPQPEGKSKILFIGFQFILFYNIFFSLF